MNSLIFFYSKIYESQLSHWLGRKALGKNVVTANRNFTLEIQNEWNKINDSVFSAFNVFGFIFPQEVFCYTVLPHPKVFPFSHPLTIPLYRRVNKNYLLSTVIHELGHIAVDYYKNAKLWGRISSYLAKNFPDRDDSTREHILVNLLHLAVLQKVNLYGWETILDRQKNISNLREAWGIIRKSDGLIDSSDPVKSIFKIKETYD